MCGICGIINYNQGSRVEEGDLRRMCSKMRHRGPDDEGVYLKAGFPSVGLGHRRLSIIDLSSAGHQPMTNEDQTLWLVLNGEVYNYQELRELLKNRGHRFRSNTDTETVIHLYEEYGQDCVLYLRGMFAFALWDTKKEELLLARDRVGKKPLLYAYENGVFSFASEFLALFESQAVDKSVNLEAIHYYLTFSYIPAPLTIYRNVHKLPPAHILVFKKGEVVLKKYWDLDYSKKIKISEEEAADEVMRLLREAIGLRLYSDVPLGAFLSGGVDSSAVVGIMSELSSKKVKTFSIGFNEKNYDELKFARNVAKMHATEHYEFVVKPQALEILPLLVERYGEPYAESSCIPTYYVCQQTKQHVTVALNGDGGDESFGGYERYQAMSLAEFFKRLPLGLSGAVRLLSRILPDSVEPKNKMRRLRRFFDASNLPVTERYLRWIGIFREELKNDFYTQEFRSKIARAESLKFFQPYFNNLKNTDLLDRILDTDVHTYLPNDLLVKVDIASMANSLEARSPFLDHKLMEFSASLPACYKIKGLVKKYILKKAIKKITPVDNINRPKMGFGVPIGSWFRGELKGLLTDTLLSRESLKRNYFSPEAVRLMVKLHVEGKRDYAFKLWTLLMLELWHQRFIDQ